MQGLHSLARALLFVVKFKRFWTVNGNPTNATSVTITVLDVTTGITVVPAGTAVPNAVNETGTIVGEYEYKYPAALPEHDYKGTIALVYGNETFTKVITQHADPPEHFASEPLAHDLSQAIAQNAAGAERQQPRRFSFRPFHQRSDPGRPVPRHQGRDAVPRRRSAAPCGPPG